MGKNVKNGGMLAFLVNGEAVFTGFRGHGAQGIHETGRYAMDLDGLRWHLLGVGMPQVDLGLDGGALTALEALRPRVGQVAQTWGGLCVVPPQHVGIGIEVGEHGLVCLPVIGSPGQHECPDATRTLDHLLSEGLDLPGVTGPWALWLSQRTAAECDELRAVVEGLRATLR